MQFNVKTIVFNAAAGLVVASTFAFMLRSMFVSEVIPPCSARYPSPTEFTLDNGTGPMSAVQLVGTIGASQRGVYRNAKVVRVRGIDADYALKVEMKPDDATIGRSGRGNGVSFIWSPSGMGAAQSICLAYSVYLPKNFDFGNGGMLPGIFAGKPLSINETSDGKTGLAQRLVWRNDGRANLFAQLPGHDTNGGTYLVGNGVTFEKDRWVAIEQEIVLNSPARSDGMARVWIDGEMEIERKRLQWRKSGKLMLNGVIADVAYGVPRREFLPPRKTAIYVSPMQLRWR